MFPYLKYYCCELWQFNYCNLKTNRSLISVMVFLYSLPGGKWHRRKSHEALGAAVVVEAFWFGTSGPGALIQKLTNGEKWEAPRCYSFWFTAMRLSVCKVTSRSICEAVFPSDCRVIAIVGLVQTDLQYSLGFLIWQNGSKDLIPDLKGRGSTEKNKKKRRTL